MDFVTLFHPMYSTTPPQFTSYTGFAARDDAYDLMFRRHHNAEL